MTVRLIYRHYCDRCHRVIAVDETEIPRGCPLPHPVRHEYAGMDLCDACQPIVQKAIAEVLP